MAIIITSIIGALPWFSIAGAFCASLVLVREVGFFVCILRRLGITCHLRLGLSKRKSFGETLNHSAKVARQKDLGLSKGYLAGENHSAKQ